MSDEQSLTQYDQLSEAYKQVSELDPIKQYLQYPGAMSLIGDVKGLRVLDAGCGNGILSKKLAEKGAMVLGFDIADKQLELARKNNSDPNIQYIKSDFNSFHTEEKFDKALSAMVFPYAENEAKLTDEFRCVFEALKPGGILAVITINKEFWTPGKDAYNRRFHTDDGMKFDWLDSDRQIISTGRFPQLYSKQQYEMVAKAAGFSQVEWYTLRPSTEGYAWNSDYWRTVETDEPFLGLVASK